MKRIAAFIACMLPMFLLGQPPTTISGKVQDKHTKEALPFVSIAAKGAGKGTATDFEGRFRLTILKPADSLVITYVGYKRLSVKLHEGNNLNMLIELEEITNEMSELIVRPGINPALKIIDAARANRAANNQDRLSAYQYSSYSKVDVSLTNISDEMRNKKVFKPLSSLFDTIHQMRNDEGKHILPVFVSETFSKYYYTRNPGTSKEVIEASRYSGIGVGADSYITDLLGGELHHFNFFNNYVRFLSKDFVSPIADEAHFYYYFQLLDSVDIDGTKCFKIQVTLKRKQDLGFEGLVWIADSSYAIKRINVEVGKNANLNFVNRIKMQEELMPTRQGPWIVVKSRASFDFDRFRNNGTGVLAGFYNAYTDIETGQPLPPEFYDLHFQTLGGAGNKDSTYWTEKRTEPISSIEQEMFNKVDSVNKLPVVKTYVDVISMIVEGYKRIGKLDWGPYLNTIGYDQVEGLRLRLGFKTNYSFSKSFMISTHLAYGFRDEKWKYSVKFDYFIDPRRWTVLSLRYRKDYDILGISNPPVATRTSNAFQVFSFFGNKVRMNLTEEYNASFSRNLNNYWSVKVSFDNSSFTPLGRFKFAWKTQPDAPSGLSPVRNSYTYSQVGIDARWAYKEVMIARGHDRIRLERATLPIFVLSYRHGIRNLFNSDFTFDKISLVVMHHMNASIFGTADWWIYTGKIFGTLPYPLLDVVRGNESPIYSDFNYSLLNFYEFVNDAFIHTSYTQHLEGLFLNKYLFVRDLKLRSAVLFKSAYGSLSSANQKVIPVVNEGGEKVLAPHTFNQGPYMEMGYTVENIFHILTLGVVHRLNYLNHRPWGYNIGLRIQF